MPSLDNHHAASVVKALVVGDTGAGKTGSLASLVDAGYKLRILDFEDKLGVLADHVKERELLKNVSYLTLKDQFKLVGTSLAIGKANSFTRAMQALNKWDDGDNEYGPANSWGPDTVLVIDSLSALGKASLNMVLLANGFINKNPEIQHWGAAMENVERVIKNLTNSDVVPCHLIVLTHVTHQETADAGITKSYPEALGNKLNPKVGRDFNNLIALGIQGTERKFKTNRDGLLMCKTSKPIKDSYPIATGLADIFKDLLGGKHTV